MKAMKFILLIISGFLMVVNTGCDRNKDSVSNIMLVEQNGRYITYDAITGNKLDAHPSATRAFQSAINRMERGGGIDVLSGKYILESTVYLRNGITLAGRGRSTEIVVTGTDSTGAGIYGYGLRDVMVRDLSLLSGDTTSDGPMAGIRYAHCGDAEMDNVYASGFSKYGIWLSNNSFLCHIRNCTASDNDRANIFTDSLHWSRAGEYMPNLITGCITYGGYNGIETNRTIVLNIVGCVVHQPRHHGYYIHNVSNSVLISGCRTYQTMHDAVVVENSHEINITGNIFCWSRGKGIVLRGVNWGTVSGNNVIDSGSEQYGGFPGTGDANGIELTSGTKCIQVTGNNIFNWGGQGIMKYALFEDETCANNSFTDLNLNYFKEGGVVSKGKGSLVKDISCIQSPSLRGNPEGPDPLFKPERLKKFIYENREEEGS